MRADAATLRLAVFPRPTLLTDALLVVSGTAARLHLRADLGQVAVHARADHGADVRGLPRRGLARRGPGRASLTLYFLVGVLGAPVYAHQDHGWDVITSASGGYIVGFVLAAAVTGLLAEHRWDRRFSSAVGAMLTGNVVIYLVGLPWLAVVLNTNLEQTLEDGLYPFVPGDLSSSTARPRCCRRRGAA